VEFLGIGPADLFKLTLIEALGVEATQSSRLT
jgi:hypothetical protein